MNHIFQSLAGMKNHQHRHTLLLSLPILLILIFSGCDSQKSTITGHNDESPDARRKKVKDAFSQNINQLPSNITDPRAHEINKFFAQLGTITGSEKDFEINDFLYADAMINLLDEMGVLDGLSRSQRQSFAAGFKDGIKGFSQHFKRLDYDRHKIMKIEEIDNDEVLVYVRHYNNDYNISFPMRWWLINTGSGWRLYDFENLRTNLRMLRAVSIALKERLSGVKQPWASRIQLIAGAADSIEQMNMEELITFEEQLRELRKSNIPDEYQCFVSTSLVTCLGYQGRYQEAIDELDSANAGGYASPVYHYLMADNLISMEEYERALDEIDKFVAVFGADSDVLEFKSVSLWHLGRLKEAREAALQGLEDNPGSMNTLADLAASSSLEQIAHESTKDFFNQAKSPETAYELALDYLSELLQPEKSKALLNIYKNSYPDSENIPYYHNQVAQVRIYSEDYAGALSEVEEYTELYGSDADILETKSDALYWLGRLDESREAALDGLEADPQSVNCLVSLIAASSPDQISTAAIKDFIAGSGDPEYALDTALAYTIGLDQIDKASILLNMLKTSHPDSELISYYDELLSE